MWSYSPASAINVIIIFPCFPPGHPDSANIWQNSSRSLHAPPGLCPLTPAGRGMRAASVLHRAPQAGRELREDTCEASLAEKGAAQTSALFLRPRQRRMNSGADKPLGLCSSGLWVLFVPPGKRTKQDKTERHPPHRFAQAHYSRASDP